VCLSDLYKSKRSVCTRVPVKCRHVEKLYLNPTTTAPLLLGIFHSFGMSAKAIREYDGKTILVKYFDKLYRQKDTPSERLNAQLRSLQVTTETDLESACSSAPWINTQVRIYTCAYVRNVKR